MSQAHRSIKKYTVDAIIVYGPEKELEVLAKLAQSGKEIDWKPAIILSATYLEKFGTDRLKQFFEKKKLNFGKSLEKLSLPQVATLLYGLDLIKPAHFTQIKQIWAERRRIIHVKRHLPAYVGLEANRKYGKWIQNTLRVIEYLKKEMENNGFKRKEKP